MQLHDLLMRYAPGNPDFELVPSMVRLLSGIRAFPVEHAGLKLQGSVSWIIPDREIRVNRQRKQPHYAFYQYVADRFLDRTSDTCFLGSLAGIPFCSYSWHSLYLNLAAYLSGRPVSRLLIVHMHDSARLYEVKYRPEIVEIMLRDVEQVFHGGPLAAPTLENPQPFIIKSFQGYLNI